MKSQAYVWDRLKRGIKREWKAAFLAAFVIGLLVHMPVMLSDIPNHDGLDSMYFDQNMITSGRWFLTVACGISSYFTLPWLIGLLAILYLAFAAAAVVEILEIRRMGAAALVGGLLVSFPALASAFAYVFTMDGYMLGVLLSVLSVLFVKKYRFGFLAGAVSLAFSMGIYQAYLPFAILLSLYSVVMLFLSGRTRKEKARGVLRYLGMGAGGAALYYLLLRILLAAQGKELASYQGIDGMGGLTGGLTGTVAGMYADFATFTVKGHVLFNNVFSAAAVALLLAAAAAVALGLVFRRKLWRSPWLYGTAALFVLLAPLGTNVILLVSPEVNYHVLMRFQWVLFLIMGVGFAERYAEEEVTMQPLIGWIVTASAAVLLFNYAVTDNIAYSNLEKRYEKTYAYCLRLLDRMEQTPGYYRGIPVAMIGVVGDGQYPVTDITGRVTGSLIGIPGDSLLYTAKNYQAFFKHYLGVELNLVDGGRMAEIYDSQEYAGMDGFPGKDSVRVVDGILYIKTENKR